MIQNEKYQMIILYVRSKTDQYKPTRTVGRVNYADINKKELKTKKEN